MTKRSILSQIAKLFDPLGLISPITVCAKALFQELCVQKCDWDEDWPDQIKCRWVKLVSDSKDVDKILCLDVFMSLKPMKSSHVISMDLLMQPKQLIVL